MSQITITVNVNDASGVAGARRRAQQVAESLQMSETVAGKAALVATELATNLIKHADHGTIFFTTSDDRPWTLTILATDKGRGIPNVPGAMRDGYSTAGSPGTGLGAIARNASVFDIWSADGKGTIVMCRVEDEALRRRVSALDRPPRLVAAGICHALAGEDVAGDAWTSMHEGSDQTTVVVVDGLGHGPAAATAANAAIVSSRGRAGREIHEMMNDAHGALRATRGAAMAVARVHPSRGLVEFVGVGNIAGVVIDDLQRRTVSHGGIVGHEMRKVQTFTYPWSPSSMLIMHSDGIGTAWNLDNYPGLSHRAPEMIAAAIFRDYARGNDDATVVVAKAV